MKYALLIYASEQDWANQTEEASQAQFQEYMAFTKDIVDRGIYQSGEALQATATATTVRVRDGETLTTDGPFAETKEQLGGFYGVEAKDRGGGGGRGAEAGEARALVERVFREESGQAVATLIRVLGDFDLAEEAVQEAFLVAVERWACTRA